MTPRQSAPVFVHPAARADLNELKQRNPWAQKAARAAMKTLGMYPERGDKKRGALAGFLSWSFKCCASNRLPSGRIIYTWNGFYVELVALSDDHDDAYHRAVGRLEP